MAAIIPSFPMITDELLQSIKLETSEYFFYYIRNEEEVQLNFEEISEGASVYAITDNQGVWMPDYYNLGIKRSYTLSNYKSLFGENGIACRNSVLGLAVIWKSSDSKQRGAINIGDICNSDKSLTLNLNYEFSKAQLRGEVEFTTIIYVKQLGTPSKEEEHLANTYGCILGEIDKFIIKLDGSGSMFPLYEVNEPNQTLWYIKCEWEDPMYDQFSECVSIYINVGHKNYKYLDKTKKTFDEQLLKEIIASALFILISKLKEENYWDVIIDGVDLESGSVAEAVNYFINTLEWDVSTPELLSISIRRFFDQRM